MRINKLLLLSLLGFLLLSPAYAINTTLTIYGLPAGSTFSYRMASNFTTINYPVTGWTTQIPIWISNATNTTYHGKVSWQYQGAGTTETYNGVPSVVAECIKS